MDFQSWTDQRLDTLRLRRLAVGWVVGSISVVAGMSFIILTSKGVAASEEEDTGPIEVQLAKEPEPEPPPPPPPPEAAKAAPKPRMVAPTTISDEKLEEKEPVKQQVDEKMEEEPKETAPVETVAPPPTAAPIVREKPKAKKPIRLTEDMPKPVQLVGSGASPEYNPEAKAAGIEGVVIIRYVIGEDGSVRDVRALKGPPELQPSCLALVKTYRFQPIIVDGSPVAVVRMARFSFRIR